MKKYSYGLKKLKIIEQIAIVFFFAVIIPISISGFIINNINQQSVRHQLRESAILVASMVSDEVDFFMKTNETTLAQIADTLEYLPSQKLKDKFIKEVAKKYPNCEDITIAKNEKALEQITYEANINEKPILSTQMKDGSFLVILFNANNWDNQLFKSLENDNRLVFSGKSLRVKDYWNERENEGKRIDTLWDDLSQNTAGSNELKQLLNKAGVFDNPKPTDLIMRCLEIGTKNGIVLDFFSGSGTTADAVMRLNEKDGGKRKYIMIQLPEIVGEDSVAFAEGYKTICDIGEERIRRAGAKIAENNTLLSSQLDTGFRVFKLDDSNMNNVYYRPTEYSQNLLSMLESNVKSDRNDLDLLFGCLLEWGLPLSLPYSSEQIEGCTVHNYNDGDLMACFDENIPDSVIKEIAKRQPLRAVFRDSSFANSPSKINVGEIFKLMAPDTRVKVI